MAILNWLNGVQWTDGAIVAAWIAFAAAILTPCAAAATFIYQRIAERWSVNKAVSVEARRLLDVLRTHEQWWAVRIWLIDTYQPLIPFSHVIYDKQVKKIGALGLHKVESIVRFYGYVGFINAFQSKQGEYKENGRSDEFNLRYHQLLLICILVAGSKLGGATDRIVDFVTHYRLKLCDLKMALALNSEAQATETASNVLRNAQEVIDAVRKPDSPHGFDVSARDDFARLENAIAAKSVTDVETALNALYEDAAFNLSYRMPVQRPVLRNRLLRALTRTNLEEQRS